MSTYSWDSLYKESSNNNHFPFLLICSFVRTVYFLVTFFYYSFFLYFCNTFEWFKYWRNNSVLFCFARTLFFLFFNFFLSFHSLTILWLFDFPLKWKICRSLHQLQITLSFVGYKKVWKIFSHSFVLDFYKFFNFLSPFFSPSFFPLSFTFSLFYCFSFFLRFSSFAFLYLSTSCYNFLTEFFFLEPMTQMRLFQTPFTRFHSNKKGNFNFSRKRNQTVF